MTGVRLESVTVVEPSPLATVTYETMANQTTFGQGLLTVGAYQYAAWWDESDEAIIGRRWNGGAWDTFALGHSTAVDDSHNVIQLGYSQVDGRLHVAMDCHASPVFYTVSPADWAGTDAPWEGWEPVTQGLGNLDPGPITYPMMVTCPGGLLQCFYRVGGSTAGTWWLAEYDGGSWYTVGRFTRSDGTYSVKWPNNGPTRTSTSRCWYPHGIAYRGDRLHMAGVWREAQAVTSPGGLANRDVFYAYSDDFGRTWRNQQGMVIARATDDDGFHGSSPGMRALKIDPFYALMNQEWMGVDSDGNPHLMLSYVPGRFVDQWGGMVDDAVLRRPTHGRLIHMFRKPDGTWVNPEIKIAGSDLPLDSYGRARAALLPNDDLVVVMAKGRVLVATAAAGWTDWRVVFDPQPYGECLLELVGDRLTVVQQPATGQPMLISDYQITT